VSSAVQIGGTIGSLFAGSYAKYGKKRCLIVSNIILVIGCAVIMSSGPYNVGDDYPGKAGAANYLI